MTNEFKHITVTPEPEEDIVIYAGLGAAHGETAAAETQGISSDGEVAEVFDAASEIHDAAQDAATDAYDDDLTLDDLKSPMPLKQRIVIIAVVICLIGAIVYCLAFMR